MRRKKIAVLGATGSIGTSTLAVLRDLQEEYEVYSLSAHRNMALFAEQIREFSPKAAAVTDAQCAKDFRAEGVELFAGEKGLIQICDGADLVILGVVGVAGLPVFEHCLRTGIPVALATKEAMVYGGRLARDLMEQTGTPVLPLDSELSAIFQCLKGNEMCPPEEILLTASGGPFRTWPLERIQQATLEQALRHPNWSMGAKITIDSATMANKGLEIMETRWMFDIVPEKITVVVHPESIVHSAVRFADNSVMAQLGVPDMKLPIAYALGHPGRRKNSVEKLDLFQIGALHFEQPDLKKFPCLALAMQATRGDGSAQMIFNASNDVAVELFRAGAITFWQISEVISQAMDHFAGVRAKSFDEIYGINERIKAYVRQRHLPRAGK